MIIHLFTAPHRLILIDWSNPTESITNARRTEPELEAIFNQWIDREIDPRGNDQVQLIRILIERTIGPIDTVTPEIKLKVRVCLKLQVNLYAECNLQTAINKYTDRKLGARKNPRTTAPQLFVKIFSSNHKLILL
jgi:hypothetical protein